MKDLEGDDLVVGEIYLLPAGQTQMVLARFSHETDSSYVFKHIRYEFNIGVRAAIYSWKRQVPKDDRFSSILAIKATDKMIKRYIES